MLGAMLSVKRFAFVRMALAETEYTAESGCVEVESDWSSIQYTVSPKAKNELTFTDPVPTKLFTWVPLVEYQVRMKLDELS